MTELRIIISIISIFIGTAFVLIASIGILRMPDFYIRMSAITKASTLGVGFIVFGIGLYFNQTLMFTKVVAIIFFVFLTSPVAAHVIARAAFLDKIPFWKPTNIDEFKPYLTKHNALQDPKTEGVDDKGKTRKS